MTEDKPEDNLIINLEQAPNEQTVAYPDIQSAIRLFFVFIFYSVVCGILGCILLFEPLHLDSPLLKSLISLLIYVVSLLFTIRYAAKKIRAKSSGSFNVSFNKIQLWLIPVVIICSGALVVGLEPVSNLIPMPKSMQTFFENAFRKDVFSMLTIIVAAPILEEIFCRAIILGGLLKNYSPLKAILISAIFFGAMHLNPWQALPAFFAGLFLGWLFYKTKSVIPGIIIHACNNALAAYFLFLPKSQQGFLSLFGLPHYILLCIFSLVVFVTGCIIIQKKALPLAIPEN